MKQGGQQQKKRRPGAGGPGNRRPGGRAQKPLKRGKKPLKQAGAKRKAPAEKPPPASLGDPTGDTDDFGYLLDGMEDCRPPSDNDGSDAEAEEAGRGGGAPANSDGEQQQQQDGGDEDGGGAAAGEGKRAKKRRKRGQKLSALEFEASRRMAAQIAGCSAEEQADWLWSSLQQHAAASSLERGGLTAEGVASLPASGGLEERLKAVAGPGGWKAAFCSREGPPGSPLVLLVSPSAIGAVGLIKLCPNFHKACRIGKLFAKHMKVEEQQEALRTQAMCLAAGTPNRLCKLIECGALRLDRLTHVVLDTQLDAKQRDILTIPETRADWWQLYRQHLQPRVDAGSLQLALINSDQLGAAAS